MKVLSIYFYFYFSPGPNVSCQSQHGLVQVFRVVYRNKLDKKNIFVLRRAERTQSALSCTSWFLYHVCDHLELLVGCCYQGLSLPTGSLSIAPSIYPGLCVTYKRANRDLLLPLSCRAQVYLA